MTVTISDMIWADRLKHLKCSVAGRRWLPWVAASVALTLFYAILTPGNRSEADDAFWFAYDVRSSSLRELVSGGHARHLLYLPLVRLLYHGVETVSPAPSTYAVMSYVSVLAAVGTVLLLVALLRYHLQLSWFSALSASSGLAVSWGFWRYSNEAEAYALAALLVLVALWLGLREPSDWKWVVLAGTVAAFASLIHVQNVIPAVLAIPTFLVLRRHFINLIVYGTVLATVGVTATLGAYLYADPPAGYVEYLLARTHVGSESHAGLGPEALDSTEVGSERFQQRALNLSSTSIMWGAVGFALAVGSGSIAFAHDGLAARLERAFPAQDLEQEVFVGRKVNPALTITAIALLLAVAFSAVAIVGSLRKNGVGWRRRIVPAAPFAIWFIAFWFVTSATYPTAAEAWTLALVPFWALVGVFVLDPLKGARLQRLGAATVIGLLAFNVVAGLIPLWSRSSDYTAQQANMFLQYALKGDVILIGKINLFRYLRYHSEAEVLFVGELAETDVDMVEDAVESSPTTYSTDDVLNSPSSQDGLNQLRARIRSSFHLLESDEVGTVYCTCVPPSADS